MTRHPVRQIVVGTVLGALALACTSATSTDDVTTSTITDDRIVVHADEPIADIDRRILGTNLPAWLGPEVLDDEVFRAMTVALGTTLLRLPGGSWSNHYDWLACELDDPDGCHWTWAARPSDFLDFMAATDLPASWTVSINGTAEEAAALVAFFNGELDDTRGIGTDRRGRDWRTVGHWASMRAAAGHPTPRPITIWEIGNEVYGAVAEAGPGCAPFGWESVWTCDPDDYVYGDADHDGFLRFREAMLAVDPTIQVGAVGVGEQASWNGWGDEVMAAAGAAIDFYVVHHYASGGPIDATAALDAPPDQWPDIAADVREGFERHGLGDVPIAITEHNLVAFLEGDEARLMPTAVNALHLADTIGQFAVLDIDVANQWNLANGPVSDTSDYGLLGVGHDQPAGHRTPAYYAMVLWSRMGDQLVAVDVGRGLDAAGISAYATTSTTRDGTDLLVINRSDSTVVADVVVDGLDPARPARFTADVLAAGTLLTRDATFNGLAQPAPDLTDAPAIDLGPTDGVLRYELAPISVTVLHQSPIEPRIGADARDEGEGFP
ncbi:MAG: hypothetical protein WD225_04785 [Ilumatobacteraceae bacterium]